MERPPPTVGPDLIWRQWRTAFLGSELRPILFLDRDGVLVDEVEYLHRIEDVHFIEGVEATVRAAREQGWRVAVVTNQAGIGRNYFSWKDFAAVNEYMLNWLDERGAVVDAVVATPHHSDGLGKYRHPDHPMRKPNPGMFQMVAEMLKGDLQSSLIVGDNVADLLAGKRSGLRRGFAVLTGHGPRYRAECEAISSPFFTVTVVANAADPRVMDALKFSAA